MLLRSCSMQRARVWIEFSVGLVNLRERVKLTIFGVGFTPYPAFFELVN